MDKKQVDLGFLISIQLLLIYILFMFNDYFNFIYISFNYEYLGFISLILFTYFAIKKFKENELAKFLFLFLFCLALFLLFLNQYYSINLIDNNYTFFLFLSLSSGILSFSLFHNIYFENQIEFNSFVTKDESRLNFSKKKTFVELFTEEPKYLLYLLSITFFSLFLQFYLTITRDIWPDEAIQYFTVKGIETGFIPNILSNVLYLRGFIYSYLQYFFSLLLPKQYFLQFTSIFFLSLSIFIFYSIAKKITTKNYSILFTFLFSVNVWILIFGNYGRPYIIALFFILLFFYFISREDYSLKNYIYISLTLFIFIFTSEMSVSLFPIYFIVSIFFYHYRKNIFILFVFLLLILTQFVLFLIPNFIYIGQIEGNLLGYGANDTSNTGFLFLILNTFDLHTFYLNLFLNYYSMIFIIFLSFIIFYYSNFKYYKFDIYFYLTLYLFSFFILISLTKFRLKESLLLYLIPIIMLLILKIFNFKIKYLNYYFVVLISTFFIVPSVIYLSNTSMETSSLTYPYSISPAFSILPSFEETSLLAKKIQNQEQDSIIIVSYGISLINYYYLDQKPDYIYGRYEPVFINSSGKYIESFSNIESIDEIQLNRLIQDKIKIILITTYTSEGNYKSLKNGIPIIHTTKSQRILLNKYNQNIYYSTPGNTSKIYLFNFNNIPRVE